MVGSIHAPCSLEAPFRAVPFIRHGAAKLRSPSVAAGHDCTEHVSVANVPGRVVSNEGDPMEDGFPTPKAMDGPWGSWLSSEETLESASPTGYAQNHGYNFEVPFDTEPGTPTQ